MPEKFEYFPTPEKQNEFKKLQDEAPIEAEQIIDSAHEEGNKFNILLKSNKIDASYLSKVIEREQTPEQVYEAFERIICKLQDIRELGTLTHASQQASPSDVLDEGLWSRSQLIRKNKFKNGHHSETLFKHHVSCASPNGCMGRFEYVIDNNFLKYVFRHDDSFFNQLSFDLDGEEIEEKQRIKFVGFGFHNLGRHTHYDGRLREEMLDAAEKLGWIDEAKKRFEEVKRCPEIGGRFDAANNNEYLNKISEVDFNRESFAYAYMRPLRNRAYHGSAGNSSSPHEGEVIFDNFVSLMGNFQGNPISGIIGNDHQINQLIKEVNDLSIENLNRAVPIYNEKGDLVWPVKMSNLELEKFLEAKQINAEQKEAIVKKLDEMAEFVYEKQKRDTAIECSNRGVANAKSEAYIKYYSNLGVGTKDISWRREQGRNSFDIRELSYSELPGDLKEELIETAQKALEIVFEGINLGKELDDAFVEEAAIKYQYYLSLQSHIDAFVVEGELYREYFKLDDFFKDQRKAIIRRAIEMCKASSVN